MKLELKVDDPVFVLDKGPGYVTRVNVDGGFEVKIAGRTSPLYLQPDGSIGGSGRQVAYYYDPVIVQPLKDLRLWSAYVRIAKQLYDEFVAMGKGFVDVE